MSNSPLNATHSQPQSPESPSPSTLPDLAALAEKFQEATQALLALCEQMPPAANKTASDIPAASGRPVGEAEASGRAGETRGYYFSPSTLQLERALLRKYHAKDFCGLLDQAHMHLVGVVKLMKSVHSDVRVRGYVISSLGCLLEQASALLLRMRNIYSTAQRVACSMERDTLQP